MSIVGFDLGQHLGWVRGNAVGPIEFGTIEMANTTKLGPWLNSARDGLRKVLRGASGGAIEQPFINPQNPGKSWFSVRKALGLMGLIYSMADDYGIDSAAFSEWPPSTGKITLAGHGHADGPMMIAAAERVHGLVGLNDHEAHALAVWHVHMFGAAEPKTKARSRSGKGVSLIKGVSE